MNTPNIPDELSTSFEGAPEVVPPIENRPDALRTVLQYGHIEDAVDRQRVMEAAAFIEVPTNVLEDIVRHATNIGEVIGGYMMKGDDAPPDVDAMNCQLSKLLCRYHVDAVTAELAKDSANLPEAEHALRLALDVAKVLAHPKGYNDGTFLAEVQALQARIDRL